MLLLRDVYKMKKIGILTAARTNNNGTDLQAYAMYSVFSRYCCTEIINYACKRLEETHKILPCLNLRGIANIPYRFYLNKSHSSFRKKFKFSNGVQNSENLNLSEYDTVVVGSDQIWNLDITGFDLNFFLPRKLGNFKRYSYAASLGKTDISLWENNFELSKLLNDFSCISVREHSGVKALNDIFVKSQQNLDPILLMNEEEWSKIIINKTYKKPYVLLYMVESNSIAQEYVKEYAKKHNCQIIRYSFSIAKNKKGVKTKTFVNIGEWLGLIKNAQMVMTNSYHGVSTSVALHTRFRVFGLKNPQSQTRLESLLDDLDLQNLFVCSEEHFEDKEIDWEKVDKKLDELRKPSLEYIKKIAAETLE